MNESELIAGYFASISTYSQSTLSTRRNNLKLFRQTMHPKPLLEISKTDIAIYAQKCLDGKIITQKKPKKLKDISVKRYLTTIKLFYEYAYEEEIYPGKEFKRIRKFVDQFSFEKGDLKTRLSNKQLKVLLQKASHHRSLYFASWFILNFGVRASELLNLEISDIDLVEKLITIRKGKGKKTRRIPIFDYQLPDLEEWILFRYSLLHLDSSEKKFLILPKTQTGPTYEWLQKKFQKISKETGIHFHAHRLRRTSACLMFYDNGISIDNVSFNLGHSSILTTQIYLGISERDQLASFREQMKGKKLIPDEALV